MPDMYALREIVRMCDHLSTMIENDRMALGTHLAGDAMRSYDELTKLEVDLLADTKRLIDRGQ